MTTKNTKLSNCHIHVHMIQIIKFVTAGSPNDVAPATTLACGCCDFSFRSSRVETGRYQVTSFLRNINDESPKSRS